MSLFNGTRGIDRLVGTRGDDSIYGGMGDDVLSGGAGNDRLVGGFGSDLLGGGAGDDTLSGGVGDDLLSGGAGNDILSGDAGDDRMAGGGGADIFRIGALSGNDTIADLNFAEGDQVWFLTDALGAAARVDNVADLLALDAALDTMALSARGADVLVHYESLGNTYQLRLSGLADEVFPA